MVRGEMRPTDSFWPHTVSHQATHQTESPKFSIKSPLHILRLYSSGLNIFGYICASVHKALARLRLPKIGHEATCLFTAALSQAAWRTRALLIFILTSEWSIHETPGEFNYPPDGGEERQNTASWGQELKITAPHSHCGNEYPLSSAGTVDKYIISDAFTCLLRCGLKWGLLFSRWRDLVVSAGH